MPRATRSEASAHPRKSSAARGDANLNVAVRGSRETYWALTRLPSFPITSIDRVPEVIDTVEKYGSLLIQGVPRTVANACPSTRNTMVWTYPLVVWGEVISVLAVP